MTATAAAVHREIDIDMTTPTHRGLAVVDGLLQLDHAAAQAHEVQHIGLQRLLHIYTCTTSEPVQHTLPAVQ